LLAKACFKRAAAFNPLRASPLGGFAIERNPGGRDFIADWSDTMLERERLGGLSVRLQEPP
jgi:hypothetical protein